MVIIVILYINPAQDTMYICPRSTSNLMYPSETINNTMTHLVAVQHYSALQARVLRD